MADFTIKTNQFYLNFQEATIRRGIQSSLLTNHVTLSRASFTSGMICGKNIKATDEREKGRENKFSVSPLLNRERGKLRDKVWHT